jgi:hypothetical protein
VGKALELQAFPIFMIKPMAGGLSPMVSAVGVSQVSLAEARLLTVK